MTKEDMVHFEDWEKLDLRVGRILKVENHPKADRLFILTVDLGEAKPRKLVAGLRTYCSKEELEGKLAIFVANLEPAVIRGVKSDGMLLAVVNHDDSRACLISPSSEDIQPGSKVR